MTKQHMMLLRISTVLWIIWGLVHSLAGVMVISADAASGFAAIADAVPDEVLAGEYHPAVKGVLGQHGWNLLWFGVVTIIGGIMIWKQSMTAIWVTAMVGGLADLGYLIFMDFPGFVNFVPGTIMTFISGGAILLSMYVWLSKRKAS